MNTDVSFGTRFVNTICGFCQMVVAGTADCGGGQSGGQSRSGAVVCGQPRLVGGGGSLARLQEFRRCLDAYPQAPRGHRGFWGDASPQRTPKRQAPEEHPATVETRSAPGWHGPRLRGHAGRRATNGFRSFPRSTYLRSACVHASRIVRQRASINPERAIRDTRSGRVRGPLWVPCFPRSGSMCAPTPIPVQWCIKIHPTR